MSLQAYRKKRDFSSTPEPEAEAEERFHTGESSIFVIQKHAARQLHYDFRLEIHGVLKSWAVPKGPSLDPKDKRLAVQTEDHPIEYASFEGNIPRGEYGGGTVIVWDRGTWESEEPPHQAYERGKLRFLLHGEKLRGEWVLLQIKRDEKHWILRKLEDSFSRQGVDIARDMPLSVTSGRTLEEVQGEK